jgi:Tol biopolymer transport system component/tRNA A-37 threonylcarbamoyl transferase component Bud32
MAIPDDLQRSLAGRYIVEREIGSGAMATVYLARDVRHDRKVALKVLKPELAAVLGVDRFLSEIKVTANLQHPNLLPLFDSGEAGGLLFYVMPYVEGETLRARLDREKQLPVNEAVRIAVALAGALGEAHEHGIVHRDLKPENIMLHAGHPIIADFGIALAVARAAGPRITQSGFSLGTPQYSSPEQAAGDRQIDSRSDIFALGAVTYEMLAGEPPFTGSSAQSIIARIMTADPPSLRSGRPSVPSSVEDAVNKALAKVPADRFRSATEFADAITNPAFTTATSANGGRRGLKAMRYRPLLYAAAAAVAGFIAGVAVTRWIRPAEPPPTVRYALALDAEHALAEASTYTRRVAISRDGSHSVYVGGPLNQLMLRSSGQLEPTALSGTEGANAPVFSPDGKSVAFTGRGLKIVPLEGGRPVTVTDSMIGNRSWGADGNIYAERIVDGGLLRVPVAHEGVPSPFTFLDTADGEAAHAWPEVLPNASAVLFTVTYSGTHPKHPAIAVADIKTGRHQRLLPDGSAAQYGDGHLVYMTSAGRLMTVPFDQKRLAVAGHPVPLHEDLHSTDFAVSDEGTLLYATSEAQNKRELVWVNRSGKQSAADAAWQMFFGAASISPDGTLIATVVFSAETGLTDIWIKQLGRGAPTKLTFDGGSNAWPTWTHNGRSITFSSKKGGNPYYLRTKQVDGNVREALPPRSQDMEESVWSPDGKWLIFLSKLDTLPGDGDLLAMRPGVDTTAVKIASGKSPAISPDGRYLAFVSDESGRNQVYVVPFPKPGNAKRLVSTQGGMQPLWSHSGKELFYRDTSGSMVSVQVSTNPTFTLGRSSVLFPTPGLVFDWPYHEYDVSRDDRRFLIIRPIRGGADKLVVVENWLAELDAKVHK